MTKGTMAVGLALSWMVCWMLVVELHLRGLSVAKTASLLVALVLAWFLVAHYIIGDSFFLKFQAS